jgi:hypothetical protein
MFAVAENNCAVKPAWHAGFLAMLPAIYDRLHFVFRGMSPDRREESIQESLALALRTYVKLFQQGKSAIAYPAPLANFAAKQTRAGRRLGGSLNGNDVLSGYCQRRHAIEVERLDRRDPQGCWREILVEDHRSTPAETAAARIDFATWLTRLSHHKRKVALTLADGNTTTEAAEQFGVSLGRVSQLRQELKQHWLAFHGELVGDLGTLATAAG